MPFLFESWIPDLHGGKMAWLLPCRLLQFAQASPAKNPEKNQEIEDE